MTSTSPLARRVPIDAAALMAIRSLELRARVVVEGFWSGLHRSPYHGFSVEFTEYRQYTPGDDPRYLDWKLFARSDRYYLKKFEDETNLRCHLLVDGSRSMQFTSTGWTKAEYARTLAATLGHFLSQQHDAVGLLTFDEQIRDYLPARNRPGHLRQLLLLLEKPAGGASTSLVHPIRRIAELVRKRGMILLLSDLLAPIESLETSLAELMAAGHEVVVMQLLDPAELDFKFDRASLFRDVESGKEIYLDPALVRRSYQEKFVAHQAEIERLCQQQGVTLQRISTDQPMEQALGTFLRSRGRVRASRRRQG